MSIPFGPVAGADFAAGVPSAITLADDLERIAMQLRKVAAPVLEPATSAGVFIKKIPVAYRDDFINLLKLRDTPPEGYSWVMELEVRDLESFWAGILMSLVGAKLGVVRFSE